MHYSDNEYENRSNILKFVNCMYAYNCLCAYRVFIYLFVWFYNFGFFFMKMWYSPNKIGCLPVDWLFKISDTFSIYIPKKKTRRIETLKLSAYQKIVNIELNLENIIVMQTLFSFSIYFLIERYSVRVLTLTKELVFLITKTSIYVVNKLQCGLSLN